MDPCCLLLILALRTGQTAATDITTLLSDMSYDPDLKLRWKYPNRPVHCTVLSNGCLDLERSAGCRQTSTTARLMGNTAGLSQVARCHDWRRGSARDIRIMPRIDSGPAVAEALGHSRTATTMGTTAGYACRESTLIYNDRSKLEPSVPSHKRTMAQELSAWPNRVVPEPKRVSPTTIYCTPYRYAKLQDYISLVETA